MNRDVIKQVILDQREMYTEVPIVHRRYAFEGGVNYCFVGIRRAGKSYYMYQQIRRLLEKGIPLNEIVYVNFEDERLMEMTSGDLNLILEIGYEFSGGTKPYLFLDEIQNVDGWSKFARRIADQKYTVSITGSNSRMLSSEIASTLGGRYLMVPVYPYSFQEYLAANGKSVQDPALLGTKEKAEIISLYNRFLRDGAFPELVSIRNSREFLNSIYQTIYLGDIIARNKVSNAFALRLILKKLAESVCQPISFSRLCNIVAGTGVRMTKQTVINYVRYILDSYLIFDIPNYAAKLVQKESSPKYYFMDTGLLGLLLLHGETAQLENLVAIELIRRYGREKVFYFEKNTEVDFYVPDEKLAIQVSFSMLDQPETCERETGALIKLHKFMPDTRCLVITNSEKARLHISDVDVEVVPAWEWLLQG